MTAIDLAHTTNASASAPHSTEDRRITQSICKLCGATVRPGAGKWIEIGRVHKDPSRCRV